MTSTSIPQADLVHLQLEKIIASRQFCKAPRLSRFLAYVVQETLAGRRERLKGYSIGVEVFDKQTDFDPQTDTIVRVQARALRQKLSQYYAQEGAQDEVLITIAKGTYAPEIDTSWQAKASTPDVVLQVEPSQKPSIAVLPFDDFSQGATQSAFSMGLTEEIIADLSRFTELSVFSRATTQHAKKAGLNVQQMRASFSPDFVLEGSVRLDDETVSVTINLIDASKDKIILVDHLDHPIHPASLYVIQDQIAEQIAWHISDSYGPIGQIAARAGRGGQSTKWETIDWIYRYHRKGIELDQNEREEIKAGLEATIKADPKSSDAHAVLAFLWLDEYLVETNEPPTDIVERAFACAHRAVDWDNQSATAYCALARAQFHQGDYVNFRRSVDQTLALNPGHADMLASLGMCFMVRGDAHLALPMLDKALFLNPLHPAWYRLIRACILMQTDGPEAALAEMRINPLPDKYFYTCQLIWMLVESGDMEGAQREKSALLDRFPDFESFIAQNYRASGVSLDLTRRVFAAWEKVGLVIVTEQGGTNLMKVNRR